jgi:peptidoglycan hydrolase CwlO-like protein
MKKFLQYSLIAFAITAVGSVVLSRGLPDSVVDPLEKVYVAMDKLTGTQHLVAPNLNSLRKSQKDQAQAINGITASLKDLQGDSTRLQASLQELQQQKTSAETIENLKGEIAALQGQINVYKDEVSDLREARDKDEAKKSKPIPKFLSLIVVGAGLFVIMFQKVIKYNDRTVDWAIGAVGATAAFWFGVL